MKLPETLGRPLPDSLADMGRLLSGGRTASKMELAEGTEPLIDEDS